MTQQSWHSVSPDVRCESRLYPGRCNSVLGEEDSTVPTDHEFMTWLTHTDVTSPTPTPRDQDERENCADSPRDTAWNVLMLRKTYRDEANTAAFVVSCLSSCLSCEPAVAEQKVAEASKRMFAVLDTFTSQSEAFQVAEMLQQKGLSITVTSAVGTDGSSGKVSARRVTHNSFHDLFRKSMQGTDEWRPPRLGRASRKMASTNSRWRSFEKPIEVIPQDPVEALLGGAAIPELEEDADLPAESGLRGMLQKHKERIRKVHRFQTMTALAETSINAAAQDGGATEDGPAPAEMDVSFAVSGGEEASGAAWDSVLGAMTEKPPKISVAKREACQLLRFFIYGRVGNEDAKSRNERERIYHETIGTRDTVGVLHQVWKKLDSDNSGRADMAEFRAFAEQRLKEMGLQGASDAEYAAVIAALPWENSGCTADSGAMAKELCKKLTQLLLGKKSSFVIEDMMRIVWPCATIGDIKAMKIWCREFMRTAGKTRVRTPPLLPREEYDGLCAVFHIFDEDGSGKVGMEELVSKGVIPEDEKARYMKEWDSNGDAELEMLEFCEMMCPAGFRAHTMASIGTMSNGMRVIYDPRLDCWRQEIDDTFPSQA